MKERKESPKLWFLAFLFTVLFIIAFLFGVYWGYQSKHRLTFDEPLKFMTPKSELTVEQFTADPIDDRDYAWDSDIPSFITKDFAIASLLNYDGVEYSFGENKICIRNDFFSSEFRLIVNSDLGWSMKDFSMYSDGENIVIYGYWNDEFRRIIVGKTEQCIIKQVLTLNPCVPFSANSKYISSHVKNAYIVVISKDMRTVSVHKDNDNTQIGDAVVLPDEILGFYGGTMILTNCDAHTDKLYVPYIIDNKGKEELLCVEVATVNIGEVDNVSDAEYLDTFHSYITKYSATIGSACCYIFKSSDGTLRMLVPNDIQKYSEYQNGTATLTAEDDLGWHWVSIE